MSRFFAVVGPSGAGKTAIVKRVARSQDMKTGVSCTTRKPRPGEEHGIHYWFITQEKYDALVNENQFIEHNSHFNASYGLLWAEWDAAQKQQRDLLVVLDVDGLREARRKIPDIASIFIMPGDSEELIERMALRGDDEPSIKSRMVRAEWEMQQADEFQYIVFNPNGGLRQAIEQVESIVQSERRHVCATG